MRARARAAGGRAMQGGWRARGGWGRWPRPRGPHLAGLLIEVQGHQVLAGGGRGGEGYSRVSGSWQGRCKRATAHPRIRLHAQPGALHEPATPPTHTYTHTLPSAMDAAVPPMLYASSAAKSGG
jgi:hypothetical protein